MEGSLEESDKHGIIPRTAQAIFDTLASSRFTRSQVTCSYLEIYNDDLADLLADSKEDSPKITIASTTNDKHNTKNSTGSKNTASSRVECRGLSEHVAESCSDVLRLMKQAQQSRRISETQMNKLSSRSHCIFTMKVTCTQVLQTGDGSSSLQQSEGKLHLVDLAGSESAKTATLKGSTAQEQAAREQERRSINKSLLTLGRVITCLKQKSRMIPYR